MNIYDVLRRLVEARAFQDHERTEALELLTDLERLNVLGTTAKSTDVGHEHEWIPWRAPRGAEWNWRGGDFVPAPVTPWHRCQVCGLEEEDK